MSSTTKWIIGIVVALIVMQSAMPFVWQMIYPATSGYGHGMPMMRGCGMHMPMMGGFGFFGLFMWLFPPGLLTLIVLEIVYLWRKITGKSEQK